MAQTSNKPVFSLSLLALEFKYEYVCPLPPTLGEGSPGITWKADVKCIHDTAMPLFEQGKEIILIGHSYGGGFSQLILLAAFVVPQRGMDLLEMYRGAWPDIVQTTKPYTKNQLVIPREECKDLFYTDVPKGDRDIYYNMMVPSSQDTWETPFDFVVADVTIPKAYIICTQDLGMSAKAQEMIVKTPGLHFPVKRMDSGHSPFLDQPARVVED
ncbi:uncharacterized protein BCR38DRAFT_458590 [Pseudomassariella vexata]|uniref:AB hydrolase-1 domain-containing protein n=1 Tax=Pseudomassariella vexata TaxID=1141098 RepID=A0A1Y2DXW2_9PEZI|nr:uncharacterized protein BCR38DRAFT_458590 [Pseudomassariella vexata]ORY63465.1 hypothetical protein BCR38DRAFT_458590 [Pseudomassariella vexata]